MAHHLVYLTGTLMILTIGDLSIIAIYHILRSGEYTKPRKVKRNGKLVIETRTQQFRFKDLGLWKNGEIISRHEALNKLIGAYSATIKFQTRKTEEWGKYYTNNQQSERDPWQP